MTSAMTPTGGCHSTNQVMHARDKWPLMPPRTTHPRPLSEATEILDTDSDSDYIEGDPGDSPHRSAGSLGTDSISTASTPSDIKTPDSNRLTGFYFHFDDRQPVEGPQGPHLFRLSVDSTEVKSSLGLILQSAPTSANSPIHLPASKFEAEPRDTCVPQIVIKRDRQSATGRIAPDSDDRQTADAAGWTPAQVVSWMQSLGFDDVVVEKFFINDISGAILLELQPEDLKELDIPSFGKRRQLMNEIRHLRANSVTSTLNPPGPLPAAQTDVIPRDANGTPQSNAADLGVDCSASPTTEEDLAKTKEKRHRRRRRDRQGDDGIAPADSASIVAIEQLLPKIHRCSKGEDCRKWQKQQAKIARLARGLPVESMYGSTILTGDPGNPDTAPALVKTPKTPKSEVTPSIVASSDVLGPQQTPDFRLSEEKLNEVQPRDPQENVRNFLTFQRLSRLQPVTYPATPPVELFPPTDADANSPSSPKMNASLAENLRHLPKLRIPSTQGSLATSTMSPGNLSAQRTITPGVLRKRPGFNSQNMTAIRLDKQPSAYSSTLSPSDYYREDPQYGVCSPFSEVDVPLTAIPLGPIARNISQSVPPNMRFGGHHQQVPDPIPRPASTKAENHRRNPSYQNIQPVLTLGPLEEGQALPPIDTLEDLATTPRAAHCRSNPFHNNSNLQTNDVAHSGWMKKRKTTRLLRHEWEDHHFTLRGTQLAMYSDKESSHRDSKALEYIDVDDYAVACSSLASSSKLTAAFKKTVLKRKENVHGETAFAFSLIPAPNNGGAGSSSGFERKVLFTHGPKSHHFAVKTRDERIDWMRELMLAKALKRGRDSGASVKLNGAPM